jgi:hypothetical protein
MPDAPALAVKERKQRINRFLPYLAVMQADLRQTLHSWVYRTWVLLSLLVAAGYMMYRFGAYQEGGLVPSASHLMSDILRWSMAGSITLIIILPAGCISSEVGNLADSVLSRGISRYQYFLGKWHARLIAVLGTFFVLGLLVIGCGILLLRDEHISLQGSLVALATVAAILTVVITCGVTISALTSSTVLGIAVVWLVLYAAGFLLWMLPANYPSPERALQSLPNTLRGMYDADAFERLLMGCRSLSLFLAMVGMVRFSRRDV